MGIEIERKFLVSNDSWRAGASGITYRQGYLCGAVGCCVRVRTVGLQEAWLSIKRHVGTATRLEYEYAIPLSDAEEMLTKLCNGNLVEKIRFLVHHAGMLWEIDEFTGANQGLIIAEVELDRLDQPIVFPDWVGCEVTNDLRYYNAELAKHPYTCW